MEVVTQVFDLSLKMLTQLFNACMNSWGIFGTWIVLLILLRKLAQAFNKTKG